MDVDCMRACTEKIENVNIDIVIDLPEAELIFTVI